MGTRVVVLGTASGVAEARHRFAEVEAVCSRFLPDGELSRINRDLRPEVTVSPLLAAVLAAAVEARERTGGLVDPAVGGAVVAWGYDRTFVEVPDRDRPPSRVPTGRWAISGRVLRRGPGVLLDLGGIAKGWTCDRVVEEGLVAVASAGGDVRSTDPEVAVEILDPWGAPTTTVRLGVGGLATSARTRRRWRVGSEEAHHLIDPRTLAPARTPVLAATATTATAVGAEAAAKAVLLHGTDGLAWAARQDWIRAALVVWHDGSVYATHGWEVAA